MCQAKKIKYIFPISGLWLTCSNKAANSDWKTSLSNISATGMKRKAQANYNLIGDYTSQKEKKRQKNSEIAEFLQDLNAVDLTGWLHSSIILNKNVWLRWRVRCKRGGLSLPALCTRHGKVSLNQIPKPNLLLQGSRSCMDYSWMVMFPASRRNPVRL